jgi:predicted nucleic acid-binding protein
LKAVANSSVLIALSTIGQLELLSRRFPEGVLVPQAVWREVVETGKGQPGSEEVASASWVVVREARDKALVSLLRRELDEGEAEAIALAREEQVSAVLLDEKDARRVARRLKLQVLGTVGLLIWARRVGAIASLREQLDTLWTIGRFHLSQSVYAEALRTVGETANE